MLFSYFLLGSINIVASLSGIKFTREKGYFRYKGRLLSYRFTNSTFDARKYSYILQACPSGLNDFYCKCKGKAGFCENFKAYKNETCDVTDRNHVLCPIYSFRYGDPYILRLKASADGQNVTFIEYKPRSYTINGGAQRWICDGFSINVRLSILELDFGFSIHFSWADKMPTKVVNEQSVSIKYKKSNESNFFETCGYSLGDTTEDKSCYLKILDECTHYTICADVKNSQCEEYQNGSYIETQTCKTVFFGKNCEKQQHTDPMTHTDPITHTDLLPTLRTKIENQTAGKISKLDIVAIVLGVVFLLGLILAVVLWFKCKNRESGDESNAAVMNEEDLFDLTEEINERHEKHKLRNPVRYHDVTESKEEKEEEEQYISLKQT